jgi:pseudomonalisin
MASPTPNSKTGFAIALFTALSLFAAAQTARRGRLDDRTINASQLAPLSGTLRRVPRAAIDRGGVNSEMHLSRLALVFRLTDEQQSDLEKLLRQQQDPASPSYRKWLTPEQYADRFGVANSDLSKISAWLRSQGLQVLGPSRSRTQLYFSGSAVQVASVLHTQIHRYEVNGESHFANTTEPLLPQALSGMVLSVRNLNDFRPHKHSTAHLVAHLTSHVSGSHFVSPNDFATIYNLKPLYTAGLDGTGVKIAVVGDSAVTLGDIDTFRSNSGLATKTPTVVTVPGTGSATHNGDEGEADLDLEWAGAVARNASITYVVAGSTSQSGAFDALQYAIDQNLAPVISNSFGLCESDIGTANAKVVQQWAQQANVQGQSITSATGDAGAADCDGDAATPPQVATKGLSVDVPAAVPEVTGVGGTEFDGDGAGAITGTTPNTNASATQFWSGTTGAADNVSSALSYIPEKAWNDTVSGQPLSAGGGGTSTIFGKPSWQSGAGVPGDGVRDVPDISLNASPNHDGYLVCTKGSCVVGFRDSADGNFSVFGGTSAGAPTFAGIIAIANQALGTSGLGNVNPTLYALAASNATAFHDVQKGDINVPCTKGTPSCPANSPFHFGFSTTANYDLATGLGSVDANELINAWMSLTISPDFALDSFIATTTSGQQTSTTVSVDPLAGFTGTVSLSCTPPATGSITCSLNPTSVSVNGSSATATLTLVTASVAANTHGEFWWLSAGGSLFAAMFVVPLSSRKRRAGLLAGLAALVIAAAAAGCGGGGSSGGGGGGGSHGTAAGNYNITITGTSGSLSHTATVRLKVN